MTDSKTYPKRPKNFFFSFMDEMCRTGAVHDIGHAGFTLCAHVLTFENRFHWRRPANFWNSQIGEILSVKDDQVRRIRQRCIDAGWLVYKRQSKSQPGLYWVTIPDFHTRMDAGSGAGSDAGSDAGYPETYKHRNIETPRDAFAPRKKRSFTDEDKRIAEYIWRCISSAYPETRQPSIDRWSHDIRLMRERDERTHQRIREVFDLAHADEFWSKNILSPQKLRKQFDSVVAKLSKIGAVNGKPSRRFVPPPPIQEMGTNGRR